MSYPQEVRFLVYGQLELAGPEGEKGAFAAHRLHMGQERGGVLASGLSDEQIAAVWQGMNSQDDDGGDGSAVAYMKAFWGG
jgi:hypothetical protein